MVLRDPQPGDIGWVVQQHGEIYAREYGWNGEFEALVADIAARFMRDFRPECEKCGSDDESMIEVVRDTPAGRTCFCNTCAHEWTIPVRQAGRFASIDEMVRRTGLRRDELTTLADIGALNAFTHERRSALWQIERAVRPAGDLFEQGGAPVSQLMQDDLPRVVRYNGTRPWAMSLHLLAVSDDLLQRRHERYPRSLATFWNQATSGPGR